MPKKIKAKATAKDFFLHLLMIITLYGSVISLITICFQTINLYIPDILQDSRYYARDQFIRNMRTAVSTLIIMFPIYIATMVYLKRLYIKMPKKLNLGVRKWLIYLSLFIGALVLIIDLIILINSFLNGELTLRIGLKILSVLVVVGTVFAYYLIDTKKLS